MGNVVGGALQPSSNYKGTGSSSFRSAVVLLAANGTIPIQDAVFRITKPAAAAALTLLAPTDGQQGTTLRIVSGTAFAHVITATGLIDDGVTGGSKSTITMGAFVGASITLVALGRKWSVLAINVAPVT